MIPYPKNSPEIIDLSIINESMASLGAKKNWIFPPTYKIPPLLRIWIFGGCVIDLELNYIPSLFLFIVFLPLSLFLTHDQMIISCKTRG